MRQQKKSKIIAIGGGSVYVPCRPAETLSIDQEAVRLAYSELPVGREKPNVLFIPTASNDGISYCHDIYVQFQLRLGCVYDSLCLIAERNTYRQVADKIAWADIIYVGGGNTRDMMNKWHETGVTDLLKQAHVDGKVLMGLSAGSICWFTSGLSDSNKFDGEQDWRPMWVSGLGLIPLLHSPHFDSERWRKHELQKCIDEGTVVTPVLALEDNCALEVIGDEYRILDSQPDSCAHFYRDGGKVILHPHEDFRPLVLLQ